MMVAAKTHDRRLMINWPHVWDPALSGLGSGESRRRRLGGSSISKGETLTTARGKSDAIPHLSSGFTMRKEMGQEPSWITAAMVRTSRPISWVFLNE